MRHWSNACMSENVIVETWWYKMYFWFRNYDKLICWFPKPSNKVFFWQLPPSPWWHIYLHSTYMMLGAVSHPDSLSKKLSTLLMCNLSVLGAHAPEVFVTSHVFFFKECVCFCTTGYVMTFYNEGIPCSTLLLFLLLGGGPHRERRASLPHLSLG